MRDYIIEALPYRPIVRIEQLSPDEVPRIAAKGLELLRAKGYRPENPDHIKEHLFQDAKKPPRIVALLTASQAIKELELQGHRPTKDLGEITAWLWTLSDEVLVSLFKECIRREN